MAPRCIEPADLASVLPPGGRTIRRLWSIGTVRDAAWAAAARPMATRVAAARSGRRRRMAGIRRGQVGPGGSVRMVNKG